MSRPVRCFASLAILFALVIATTGCGSAVSEDGVSIARVSGKVALDGQPLADATITFVPNSSAESSGIASTAITNSEGEFRLMTQTKKLGAVVGPHSVKIEKSAGNAETDIQRELSRRQDEAKKANSEFTKQQEAELLMQMKNRQVSGALEFNVTFEVPAEGTKEANFELSK